LLDKKEENSVRAIIPEKLEGLKVLLIDDDEMSLKFATLLLNGLGAEVVSYLGGVEFINKFIAEDFNLILLDIQMPEVDGFQVFNELKARGEYKNVPILAMTANVFTKDRENMMNEGFDGFLLKPFRETDLVKKITEFVRPLQGEGVSSTPVDLSTYLEEEYSQDDSYSLTEIKRFCMGDEALFKEVIEGFYTQTGLDLILINKACDENNYEKVQAIAHQLSSRLGQLKFTGENLAKSIEETIKKGNTDKIQEQVWELTDKTNTMLEDLAEKFGYAMVD
jgi:CheY-like chemotaxis protein/HPt (histidine-containing phosphotransfer) domain-containing protein